MSMLEKQHPYLSNTIKDRKVQCGGCDKIIDKYDYCSLDADLDLLFHDECFYIHVANQKNVIVVRFETLNENWGMSETELQLKKWESQNNSSGIKN